MCQWAKVGEIVVRGKPGFAGSGTSNDDQRTSFVVFELTTITFNLHCGIIECAAQSEDTAKL